MSLYHRCTCPNNLEQDCAHPWHYKFMVGGRRMTKSTKQTDRAKAAQIEIKAHAMFRKAGAGPAPRHARVGRARRLQAKTVAEELLDIAMRLVEDAKLEMEGAAVTPERALALGMAAGAVMRARSEWLQPRAPQPLTPSEAGR